MANKARTGMQGVYLVAAELTYRGFIVSVTSRNAFGADLLVTDQACNRTWSVQVKTNSRPASYWLLSKHSKDLRAPSHIYVFVNLKANLRPEFHVVTSEWVANHAHEDHINGGTWYSFDKKDTMQDSEGWEPIFGNPIEHPDRQLEADELLPS